uniref:Uncharacterized protein n=1 Tax=Tetranychus urticae TaxID=32264 RepID=T1KMQ1_TETUR
MKSPFETRPFYTAPHPQVEVESNGRIKKRSTPFPLSKLNSDPNPFLCFLGILIT